MWHQCNLVAKECGLERTCVNNDDLTVLVSGSGRCHWASMCTVWCCIQNDCAGRATNLHQVLSLTTPPAETIRMIQKATAMGNWWLAASSWHYAHSCINLCRVFWVKHQITQVTQPHYSQDLAPCNFWLFPKLKSPLKGKRFQIINEIQEDTMGQLMTIGRTWGPKVPTLKGTEASLSYV